MLSLPLARAPESQLAAGQSLTGRPWTSPRRTPHVQGQRRSHSETVNLRRMAVDWVPVHLFKPVFRCKLNDCPWVQTSGTRKQKVMQYGLRPFKLQVLGQDNLQSEEPWRGRQEVMTISGLGANSVDVGILNIYW